jgi:hypothetical protein
MQACGPPMANQATNEPKFDNSIRVDECYEILGHCGDYGLQKTAHIHGLKLKGNVEFFEDCTIPKARQKNLNKEWKGGSQVSEERLYFDISSL